MTNLLGFPLRGGIPGELLHEPEPIDDNGLLVTEFSNTFRSMAVAETAFLVSAHGRFGNDKVNQAIVDADRARL